MALPVATFPKELIHNVDDLRTINIISMHLIQQIEESKQMVKISSPIKLLSSYFKSN